MTIDLNEGIPLGRTHEEQRQDELMKALHGVAMQCFNTCEAIKGFHNMIYDVLDTQGVIADVIAKSEAKAKTPKKTKGKK